MKKTLFTKYLRITSLIIVISFFFLGLVMLVFITRFWQNERQEMLGKSAQNVADIASQSVLIKQGENYTIDGTRMYLFIRALSTNADADIFVTDTKGNKQISAFSGSGNVNNTAINQDIMKRTLQGAYIDKGTLNGTYNESYYVVGIPIKYKVGSSVINIGAVFAASNSKSLDEFRFEVFKMFLLAAIAAFLISFCVVWLFTYKMVRPLREMSSAAHSFGEGNFSIRVPVNADDEIGQLGLAFNNMAIALSSGENMRRNFIANVSHELKTPMTTIAGFIDGILDGTIPPEKQSYYLKIVSQEIKRLSRLVKTMLDLSRIDSGELKIRPARFDLTNTILVSLLTFEKSIEDKQLQIRGLENAESLFVDGDPDMIHQVVYNLFENAVKFTNEGGYIEITILDLPDRVSVKIKNSGLGIPPDEIAMIFDRFYKTDKSRSRDKNGMGLGLYIVRTIIKLHGGEINVSSVENEYCAFEFWLPKQKEQPKLKENAKESAKDNNAR